MLSEEAFSQPWSPVARTSGGVTGVQGGWVDQTWQVAALVGLSWVMSCVLSSSSELCNVVRLLI